MREEQGSQLPICHVSKTFKNAELQYSKTKKVRHTLLLVARTLQPYFHAHSIKIMTGLPLERHLKNLEKLG